MIKSDAITGILLAAGTSQRFGGDKLLHTLPNGVPIAVASAQLLKASVDRALAVVNPQATRLAQLLEQMGLTVVTCPEAKHGMSHSLACGINASADAQGWVIALADMPFIQVATFYKVVHYLRQGTAIVAPQFQGQRGHPVGFQKQFRESLCSLSGDRGARTLLQQNAITLFPCHDAGILQDIDSYQDIRRKDHVHS
jgi:molybdenum cofactor cytidylyltransferase